MAAILNSKPRTGGGHRPPVDRSRFGSGGGGRNDGLPDYAERLRRCRLGLAIVLVAIVLFFVVLSGAFLLHQQLGRWDPNSHAYLHDWLPLRLPLTLLLVNSLILALSAMSIELARRQAVERMILAPVFDIPGISAGSRPWPWLALSALLGSAFLAGQALAWRLLLTPLYLPRTPAASFFFVLTGAHALHVAAGVLALLNAAVGSARLRQSLELQRIIVDITAWYWQAMVALWLYLFGVLALGR